MSDVLDVGLRDDAVAVARELAHDVAIEREHAPFVLASLATFFASVDRLEIVPDALARAERCLERAIDAVAQRGGSLRMVGGLPGFGWLSSRLVDAATADDLCGPIDRLLASRLATPEPLDYDLVRGIVGWGVYALPRAETADGRRLLEGVLARLEATAASTAVGLRWFTPAVLIDGPCPSGGRYDYGMAHGLPGVIAFLARCIACGFEVERCRRMIDGAMSTLLAVPAGPRGRFPFSIAADGAVDGPARLAWCYGDPGVALAMFAAARATGRADWDRAATEIAVAAAERNIAEVGVEDAALCHGAAGLGHAFHRMYLATNHEALRDASVRWLRHTAALRRPGEGPGGYRAVSAARGFVEEHDVLTLLAGSTGIALVLLAGSTDVDASWDDLFLFGIDALGDQRQ